jgi:hypothetical protein
MVLESGQALGAATAKFTRVNRFARTALMLDSGG